ncbi:PEP-CTERM sorting domain-containing protein [Hymenobacter nivis]|uniref:PEP-CTERM sorting domain-containing protein n=1 Tax=Hymenobacter nivis TaxID=1850093 RepID=A0A502HB24_9BACT|nr:PEP-CTERM sorting domain-containing protein [Hymenobacter nivis]TPG71949.1 PEP-CTERM sorting domain-containing protein [Hymenobacter nivis]
MRFFSWRFPALSLAAGAALLLHGPAANAQKRARPGAPVAILFVGNSFTHGGRLPVQQYNAAAVTDENYGQPQGTPRQGNPPELGPWGGIPAIFKKLADEAGLNYDVHSETLSGQTLKFHYDNALSVIAQPRWQAVVLQEYSTGALPERHSGKRAEFYDYGTRLEQAVHQANPAARLYLYETWARADLTYPPNKPYSGQPVDSMTADLRAGYYGLARANGHFAGVAPAGDAWLRAIQTGVALPNPYEPAAGKLDLWTDDHYHPSSWGAYLNACVLLATITGQDPRTLGPQEQAAATLGIAPPDAVALQRLAYEQVQASPKAEAMPRRGRLKAKHQRTQAAPVR